MLDALAFQHAADLDRPRRREAAIGIDQQRDLRPERAPNGRHDLFGAARPFIDVVPVLRADAELEGLKAEFTPQSREALRFFSRGDVPLHR